MSPGTHEKLPKPGPWVLNGPHICVCVLSHRVPQYGVARASWLGLKVSSSHLPHTFPNQLAQRTEQPQLVLASASPTPLFLVGQP